MTKRIALALMTTLLGHAAIQAALPPLFENGESMWQISLPTVPSPPEEYAALELQTTLQKISGVTLVISSNDVPPQAPAIIIGTRDTSPAVARLLKKGELERGELEKSLVRLAGNKLLLAGNQPRAALYAVYSFLREELDCRWFWPGDDGEFLPKLTSYTIPAGIDRTLVAAFRYREMTPCWMHLHVPTERWMARNFLNNGSRTVSIRDRMGLVRSGGGHHVAVPKKMFETHPELFGIINGKPDPDCDAGCWSNPDFTALVVKQIVDYAGWNNLEHLNVFPADITHRCECANCTANPDVSGRWYNYYKVLMGKIREQLPEMSFGGIAYQEYRQPPTSPVEGLEYVQHCQYSRCYIHKFDNPDCDLNRKTLAELNAWREKAPMGIYGYEFDVFNTPMYLPFWNMLQDEIKLYRELGIVYMKTELSVQYPADVARFEIPQQAHRLANYLYAQLLWNPDAELDGLISDWCRHLYGPAASPLLDYHRAMAAAWDAMTIHATYFGAKPDGVARAFLNDELISRAKGCFAAAEQALADEPAESRQRQEVALERALFDKWEKIHRLASDNAVVLPLTLLEGDDSFAAVAPLPMQSKGGNHLPTVAKIYWSAAALHIRVESLGLPDWKELPTGFAGRDIGAWGPENVEIFLSDHKISPFWQIAVNPSGLIYDAIGSDKSWNPALEVKTELIPDGWRATIKIPFTALESSPKAGDQWQLVLNRNSSPEACGFPFPSYHDIASGATILFSVNTKP